MASLLPLLGQAMSVIRGILQTQVLSRADLTTTAQDLAPGPGGLGTFLVGKDLKMASCTLIPNAEEPHLCCQQPSHFLSATLLHAFSQLPPVVAGYTIYKHLRTECSPNTSPNALINSKLECLETMSETV